ncbi:sodium:proton antiporter [Natrinema thermotolerans]|uniref:Sodium:proton antiporter n=1 Tax=Natrinema thermotolerans TaxID=121872 RepID=A0AAF0P9U5_9EURY|nr:MnhB domain-containing protein [Natrinema thermotolerans]ELZ10258.1 Na+/H+ antiporter MnhB subunit-related protein [Natrinema thermotolerans DSM 11552]QCC60124.1 sodium:proton antiporter [Natrinema thermotolerans]QCC61038.1 sodium:proton antiporter [Natrinema thermotolerans]WMT07135.1 sodium:proton antiporter [Natrinema thermotolerans]
MTTVIMRTTARAIVPIVLVVAISLFFEGHNLPGGGFIGGVLTVTAFGIVYMAFGLDFLERGVLGREVDPGKEPSRDRVVLAYRRLFAYGFAIAVLSGLVPLVFDRPFLTQTFVMLEGVPIYDHLEVASAMAFDFGVYCVVVGGLLTILSVVGAE